MNIFSLACSSVRLIWQAARLWTIAWGALLLLQGLLPATLIYLTRTTVNLLTASLATDDTLTAFTAVWPYIAAIATLLISGQILTSLTAWVRTIQAELVQDQIKSLIHQKALQLDIAFFEKPDSYDLLYRASVEAIDRPVILLENLGNLLKNSLTLLLVAIMLWSYTPLLPLLLTGSALPGLWIVGRFILRERNWRRENTVNERRARYLDWMMTERESAAEMRLFGLGEWHRSAYRQLRGVLREGRRKLAGEELRAETLAGILSWSGALGGMIWMLRRTALGAARLGDLVLCYQAFQQGQTLLRALMENSGQIYRCSLFLDDLFRFLQLQPVIQNPPQPLLPPSQLKSGISFEKVTFSYPGSARIALHDFSLQLPAGQVTAIVGENGAGKSTLIKLLCRFYDPDQGRILLDGIDLKNFQQEELWRQITVLFQEPVHYHSSARENIVMGDLAANEGQIKAAALAGGAASFITKLPQGYATELGAWFGGAELSVGEWQRLALSRAFLRNAPLIILDEPTSAMDSWAENDWLGRFRQLTAGRTALMITHRFTTAMHADIIHVMADGRIIESGSHTELVARGGNYAASWRAQLREIDPG